MERTNFYNKTIVDGIEEYDYLYNNISKLTLSYPVEYYRVQENDLMRMDLISYKIYGSIEYWWIIATINGIEDIFHDMEVGQVLTIPNKIDIYNFYKRYAIQ